MWDPKDGISQDSIQMIIFLIAFVCVPWMLLPKPIIEIKKMNKHKNNHNNPLMQ